MPIDLAVNCVKDLFGLGDEDNTEPFRFKDYLFGEEGIIQQAIDFVKDIFTVDFSAIGDKFFDMGRLLKAALLASGSYVAAGLNIFDGVSGAEAYAKKFNEVMAGGDDNSITNNNGGDNIQGDTSTIENNTKNLMENDNTKQDSVVIVNDSSSKDLSTKVSKTENSYPPMDTGIDPFFNNYREAAYG